MCTGWQVAFLLLLASPASAGRRPSSSQRRGHRLTTEYRDTISSNVNLFPLSNQSKEPEASEIRLGPVSDDQSEWHFSFIGVKGTCYEDGVGSTFIRCG